MRHFLIATNPDKDINLKLTTKILDYLEEKEADAYVVSDIYRTGIDKDKIPKETECAITLGGDGTILQMSRALRGLNIPVIGVNLGNVGFLAEIEPSEMQQMLDGLLNDEYRIDYLRRHIRAMKDAVETDGVDVMGYTTWGCIDLISASTGEMKKRYGLVYVDLDDQGKGTGKRIKKASYNWYRNVIASNGEKL